MSEEGAGCQASIPDQHGTLSFQGFVGFFVESGVLPIRIQIWKKKFESFGGKLETHVSRRLTHVFATSSETLKERIDQVRVKKLSKLSVIFVTYEWIEECLKAGYNLSTHPFQLVFSSADDSGSSGNESAISDREPFKFETLENFPASSERELSPCVIGDVEQQEKVYEPPNLNRHLTVPFGQLRDIYKEALGDLRRSFSYQKAATTLEKLPFEVQRVEQVKNLPNIGKSMQDHIYEILTTGKLSKLDHFKEDEQIKTVSLFGSIWGVGPTTALKLYNMGHRTLEDLAGEKTLTSPQRIGLQYYDDIKQRIPRDEVRKMEKLIQIEAQEMQSGIVVQCCGSYRRGKATVGDIDMVLSHPDGTSHKGVLPRLVQRLKEMNFLTDDLVVGYHEDPEEVDTYFGLCRNPQRELRHRIDFKVYSAKQYPFGLIAWTGNDVLNRRLKIQADIKGYKLDDKGLYRTTLDQKRQKISNRNTGVPCKTEREVFEFLDFPWLEPTERNL